MQVRDDDCNKLWYKCARDYALVLRIVALPGVCNSNSKLKKRQQRLSGAKYLKASPFVIEIHLLTQHPQPKIDSLTNIGWVLRMLIRPARAAYRQGSATARRSEPRPRPRASHCAVPRRRRSRPRAAPTASRGCSTMRPL